MTLESSPYRDRFAVGIEYDTVENVVEVINKVRRWITDGELQSDTGDVKRTCVQRALTMCGLGAGW